MIGRNEKTISRAQLSPRVDAMRPIAASRHTAHYRRDWDIFFNLVHDRLRLCEKYKTRGAGGVNRFLWKNTKMCDTVSLMEALKRYCEETGEKPYLLGRRAGVAHKQVYNLVNGLVKSCSTDTVRRLSEATGIPMETLINSLPKEEGTNGAAEQELKGERGNPWPVGDGKRDEGAVRFGDGEA